MTTPLLDRLIRKVDQHNKALEHTAELGRILDESIADLQWRVRRIERRINVKLALDIASLLALVAVLVTLVTW
jgi:hypothetical protein